METETLTAIIELVSQITVSAILFIAWRQEREERVKSQDSHITDLRRYADLAQIMLEGGRAAIARRRQRIEAEDQTDLQPGQN